MTWPKTVAPLLFMLGTDLRHWRQHLVKFYYTIRFPQETPPTTLSSGTQQAATYMYPTQSNEIVLVLYEEEFLLVFCVTIVRPTALFRYNDVCNGERISGLGI